MEIAPTTLGDNVVALADLHRPTVGRMETEVLAEGHIHVDDTPVVVLVDAPKEDASATPPAEPQKKKIRLLARVWTYVSLSGKVFYRFTEDRSRDMAGGPAEVLAKFKGTLIGDEYAGYDKISRRPGMTQAGCWAHCRRKFKDALGEDKKRAGRFIMMIAARRSSTSSRRCASATSPEETRVDAPRLLRSATLVEETGGEDLRLRRVDSKRRPPQERARDRDRIPPQQPRAPRGVPQRGPLVPPDNNAAERALRGIAVGRKNYLHFGSLAGGDTAAVLYSLIGSWSRRSASTPTPTSPTRLRRSSSPTDRASSSRPGRGPPPRRSKSVADLARPAPVTTLRSPAHHSVTTAPLSAARPVVSSRVGTVPVPRAQAPLSAMPAASVLRG